MLKFLIICLVVCCATSAPQNYENQDSFLDRSKWNEERLNRVQIERNIRIVGGSSAQPNQFQHAVALFLKLVNSDSFCGGSIIHPNFIVTAAHCLDDLIEIEVYAGVTNINRGTPPYRAIVPRSDTRQHDTYNRATLRDDIGLVCVRQAIPRTPVMRPVALPSSNLARNSLANQTPFIIGWGRTSDGEFNAQLTSCRLLLIRFYLQRVKVSPTPSNLSNCPSCLIKAVSISTTRCTSTLYRPITFAFLEIVGRLVMVREKNPENVDNFLISIFRYQVTVEEVLRSFKMVCIRWWASSVLEVTRVKKDIQLFWYALQPISIG